MSVGLEDDKLNLYFDGELPESEAAEVRRLLEESADDRARLEQLERLRTYVALAAEEMAADVPSDSLFEQVRSGIADKRSAGYHEPFRVLPGEKKGDKRAPEPRRHGVESWRVWGPAAAVAAVAAAFLLFIWSGEDPSQTAAGTDAAQEDQGDATSTEVEIEELAVSTIEPPQGSEVEEVDFGGNTGTVFAVQGEAGEPIAVVWINDEAPDQVTQ